MSPTASRYTENDGNVAVRPEETKMLLVIAILLLLIFGGLGFVAHVLWLGLILALIIGIAHMLTGGRRSV